MTEAVSRAADDGAEAGGCGGRAGTAFRGPRSRRRCRGPMWPTIRAAQALTDKLFVDPVRADLPRQTRRRARGKVELAGKVGAAFPTADPAQGSVDLPTARSARQWSGWRAPPWRQRHGRSAADPPASGHGRASGGATKASKPRVSRMMISRSSLAVTGSISSSSHGKSSGCRLIHPPQYRFASSSIQTSTNIDHDMNRPDLSMQAKYAALYHWRYSYPRVVINSYSIQ